jgi:ABC-type Fe3+/spermidine/putrescine transport system ATPase subunit
MRGIRRDAARDLATGALRMVGLEAMADRAPSSLSGGQRQRVAIARALVFRPTIVLMDEPLSSLDRALRDEMTSEIRRLQHETGVTVIYVTHDQSEALSLSSRVGVLGRGRLLQLDVPEVVHERPLTPYVARLVGPINIAGAQYEEEQPEGGVRLRIGTDVVVAEAVADLPSDPVVGVRPYRARLDREDGTTLRQNALAGTVVSVSLTGSGFAYQVDVGLTAAWEVAAAEPFDDVMPGTAVRLTWPYEATVVMASG